MSHNATQKYYTVYTKSVTGFLNTSQLLKGIRCWTMYVGDGITSVQVYSEFDAREVVRRILHEGHKIYRRVKVGVYQCRYEELPEEVLMEDGYVERRDKD